MTEKRGYGLPHTPTRRDRKNRRSRPLPKAGGASGPCVQGGYEQWAVLQLRRRGRCRVERSMRCIPLREDMICRECYESYRGKEEGKG